MTKIILYGKKEDKTMTLDICNALSEYGGVMYICENELIQYGSRNTEYIVFETDKIDTLISDSTIIIFKTLQNNDLLSARLGSNIIAVTEADNNRALRKLSFLPIPAIGCGMSERDTMTISGRNEKEAAVSVQRTLPLPHNKCIEPCEIKVKLSSDIMDYPLLAITSVLLLSEKNQDGYLYV